ncbi:testis-expressed protein 9 [Rhipicephalus sanguineus]|uniref:testis-expressed protein 9 n=1 Tax=Rhipicephalus sanguineus TaxID=34632 RepID=UPI00189443FF|nr:testis-expressed protein 9 [Rhipicephalus sanguineus]XP_049271721.1 testis-expressed protein 9 [Rhipicephalus sanguineus]
MGDTSDKLPEIEKSSSKDYSTQRYGGEDKAMAELLEKNQQLEKQKADLLALIKKQMKLIDILKKQKIHLESTRIIQFTEDELIHLFGIDKKDQNL